MNCLSKSDSLFVFIRRQFWRFYTKLPTTCFFMKYILYTYLDTYAQFSVGPLVIFSKRFLNLLGQARLILLQVKTVFFLDLTIEYRTYVVRICKFSILLKIKFWRSKFGGIIFNFVVKVCIASYCNAQKKSWRTFKLRPTEIEKDGISVSVYNHHNVFTLHMAVINWKFTQSHVSHIHSTASHTVQPPLCTKV